MLEYICGRLCCNFKSFLTRLKILITNNDENFNVTSNMVYIKVFHNL